MAFTATPVSRAHDLQRAGDVVAAFDCIAQAIAADPDDLASKAFAANLLRYRPDVALQQHKALVHAMLVDPTMDPRMIERAGWLLVVGGRNVPSPDADPAAAAAWLEDDQLALDLLCETQLTLVAIERILTEIRRWLLLSGREAEFPRSVAALLRQAAHNGGCWPFDAEERAALDANVAMRPAYLPPHPVVERDASFNNAITDAVAEQYRLWPYPVWQRVMITPGNDLPRKLAAMGPGAPILRKDCAILVAGCGTGREALRLALGNPEASVTAIDLSATSLAYARQQSGDVDNLRFVQLDLHDVAMLGQGFDVITCCGVLHHLPEPEAGWDALVRVLRPGGAMRVMVYSRIARLRVAAARSRLGSIASRPIDADLLRDIRALLMAEPADPITGSVDFFSMGGLRDLVIHTHEDAFDVPRIRRAIDRLGLTFLGFSLATQAQRTSYAAQFPHDPYQRDFDAWSQFERGNVLAFAGMYDFWCSRPA